MRLEIRKKRLAANLTQKNLAEMVGVQQAQICRIESGQHTPSVKTAKKIAAVLGFDWTEFYEEKE